MCHAFGKSVPFCAVRIYIVAMCMQFLAYSRTLQQRFPASVFTTTMQMQCVGMLEKVGRQGGGSRDTRGEEVERQVARNGCYRSSRFGTLRSNEGKRRGAASMTKAPGRKENERTRAQSNGAGGVGATDAVRPSSCSRPSKTSMYVDQIYVDRPRRFHWEVAYANS